MTQREKLVRLISDMQDGGNKQGDHVMHTEHISNEKLADYLLTNGVIVPPVSIGQTLYLLHGRKILEYMVTNRYYDDYMWRIECRNDEIEEHRKHIFYDYAIGHQVFYSRRDAVKEIQECEGFATYPGGSSPAPLYYKSEKR